MKYLVVLIVILSCFQTNGFTQEKTFFPNRLLVKYESNNLGKRTTQSQSFSEILQNELNASVKPAINAGIREKIQAKQIMKTNTANSNRIAQLVQELAKWYEIELPSGSNSEAIQAKIKKMEGVISVEPRRIRYTTVIPNDPLLSNLTFDYYNKQNFYSAWDVEKANSAITIAIVDSGVDFTHTDLDGKKWINTNEIAGNGIDDDQNGWVDDVFGWDFWQSGDLGGVIVEDNDPRGDASSHGTHVAGIAAAETNNGQGIAGAGYNASYMAIKAGGAPGNERTIAFGYEGMLYAAINGADIINCSWGGFGSSTYENDIVQTVLEMGSLIVAASGNDNEPDVYYPASYSGVLSVGSVTSINSKASYSNYGYKLDVMANGSSINSTVFNNQYALNTGTSMASPFVAGLAALVKAKHPDWKPEQIKNQIRVTATPVYSSNQASYEGMLGRGLIHASAALGEVKPGFIISSYTLLNSNNDKIRPGENGTLTLNIKCVNPSAQNITLKIASHNNDVVFVSSEAVIPPKMLDDEIQLLFPVSFSSDFNVNALPVISASFTGTNYFDEIYFQYDKLLYDEHINEIKFSVASDGTVGFVDINQGIGGVGFIPKNVDGAFYPEENILYSASLLLGLKTVVADRAVSDNSTENNFIPTDYYTISDVNGYRKGNGNSTVSYASFPDLKIRTNSYSTTDENYKHVVWVNYIISNPTPNTIDSLYVGYYVDFDINEYDKNSVLYNESNQTIITKSDNNQQFAGLTTLNQVNSAIAIDNAYSGTDNEVNFSIYDGFTKAEKWNALTQGLAKTSVNNTDVSNMISSGPYRINSSDSISVGFLWSYATSLDDLTNYINNAKQNLLFSLTQPLNVSNEEEPEFEVLGFEIHGNYPNPFNPSTTIKFSLPKSSQVRVAVYNSLGRLIQRQSLEHMNSGNHSLQINLSNYSSGVYFVQVSSSFGVKQIPITLIK
ncbi:T9SS type A sorting domain-containing protein [bacterium]|nr:MAG: T9SS type A sorting domain-containing protein [bacterium]